MLSPSPSWTESANRLGTVSGDQVPVEGDRQSGERVDAVPGFAAPFEMAKSSHSSISNASSR